jgi:anti-sigma-K factor RskA
MPFSEETLVAYVDGELDATTQAEVDRALQTDADLARRIGRHRDLRARVALAHRDVLDEPVPAHLTRLLDPDRHERGVTPIARGSSRENARRWMPANARLAMAACLVLGVTLGLLLPLLLRDTPAELRVAGDGRLQADGALAHALERAPSATGADNVRIGLTFVAANGNYCRTFALEGRNATHGLACREASGWQIEVLERAQALSSDGGYRQAGTALSPALRAVVEGRMRGVPLDAEQEQRALHDGWRAPAK